MRWCLVAFQGEPSKAVRAKLFNQVLADDAELRDCLKEQEGGTAAAKENMTVEPHDLNRDGVKEYEVQLSGMCSCGTQNCTIYLYRATAQGFDSILEERRGWESSCCERRAMVTPICKSMRTTALRQSPARFTNLTASNIGKRRRGSFSSKPAKANLPYRARAVQTRQLIGDGAGKVSIALPDTLLVGARAGQTMTVQLTSPQKSVRFMVMSPDSTSLIADNARTWTGTLPETGDYHIIVDGDERGGTYTMTISIR